MDSKLYLEKLNKVKRQREDWLRHNSIDITSNLSRVILLAKHKLGKFENCTISPRGFSPTYLEISYKSRVYKIVTNEDKMCLTVLSMNMANNKKQKELYHVMKDRNGVDALFYGDSCWELALDFLNIKMRSPFGGGVL